MNINDLTIGEAKELVSLFCNEDKGNATLNGMIGKKVIVRTFSADVWFGTLYHKEGNEVILTYARRMYRWLEKESISLSAVAIHGIKQDKSKIVEAVPSVWLEAIEIIPCSEEATRDLESAPHVEAQ